MVDGTVYCRQEKLMINDSHPVNKIQKLQPVVIVHMVVGKVSPAMRAHWNFAWKKILAKANEAAK